MEGQNNILGMTSRKFFGFAVGHEPAELYEAIHTPAPDQLATETASYLVKEAMVKDEPILTPATAHTVRILFYAAINDVRTILTDQHYKHHLPIESLPHIARDERTLRTIASIAMHNDGTMRHIINMSSHGIYYDLGEDSGHLTPKDRLHIPPAGGCPFATNSDRLPEPAPIFKRTVGFAADLTTLALKNHTRNK